jgi:hypothetical protein
MVSEELTLLINEKIYILLWLLVIQNENPIVHINQTLIWAKITPKIRFKWPDTLTLPSSGSIVIGTSGVVVELVSVVVVISSKPESDVVVVKSVVVVAVVVVDPSVVVVATVVVIVEVVGGKVVWSWAQTPFSSTSHHSLIASNKSPGAQVLKWGVPSLHTK